MCHFRPRAAAVAAAAAFAVAGPAMAQDGGARTISVQPTFAVQQTFTDNVDLRPGGRSEAITQVSPGIRLDSRRGRIQGTLDYTANGLLHARDSSRNTVQNALSAAFVADIVESTLTVDARASVSQQSISAFGTPVTGPGLVNANQTEVAVVSIAPTLRGNLAGWADVTARTFWTVTNSDSVANGDSTAWGGQLSLAGRQGAFGWGLDASRTIDDFDLGARSTRDTTTGTLAYIHDESWRFSLRGGRESNDIGVAARRSYDNWGYGVDWIPGERTSVSYNTDRRFFGRSHNIAVNHRMARTLIAFVDSRGLSGGDVLGGDARTVLDAFRRAYNQCLLTLQGLPPDLLALQCEVIARANSGLDPRGIGGGFLNSALSLQRTQSLSLAYSGLRTTYTFSAQRGDTRQLSGVSYAGGDLSLASEVRQLGWTLGVAHRLTPETGVSIATSRNKTLDAGALLGNDQQTTTASLTTALGPRTSGSLVLRHTEVDGATPYNESAIIGSLGFRF